MNYIGSKLSLLPFIEESIKTTVDEQCETFCDLFAGTGAVGKHFKKLGYSIIANDMQYYSYILNKHYIETHKKLDFKHLELEMPLLKEFRGEVKNKVVCDYLCKLDKKKGFIYKNYSSGGTKGQEHERMYYSDDNASKCDAIRQKIEQWKDKKKITMSEYYFLLTVLLENVDKHANTASVYGAFLKSLKKSAQKVFKMNVVETVYSSKKHKVYNEDVNSLVKKISSDIVYLDPPYNHRQYSCNYHLLETICKYDNPTIKGKTGLREYKHQKSMYCYKKEVIKSFTDLIISLKCKYIFLSYNNEGLMSIEDIKSIMSLKGEYGCMQKEYSRYKADKNRDYKGNKTIEYLHYVKCK